MMLDNIKNRLHQGINELFATAAVDELAGDTATYREKLGKIAHVAEVLGISAEVVTVSLDLKDASG